MPPPPVQPESTEPPIFLWVNYKPEEVNSGYWSVFRELALPRTLITVFCSAFVIGVPLIVVNMPSFEPLSGLLLLALVAFVFPPVLCLYAYLLLRARLMHSYENRPNFHFPMMYTINSLGCQVQYASGAGLLDWRHFSLAIESPSAFYLASSVDDVFVLPKRCLADQVEVGRTREIIKKYVRQFRRARGRQVEIAFEKAAIQSIIAEGIDEVVRVAEENQANQANESNENRVEIIGPVVDSANAADPTDSTDSTNPTDPTDPTNLFQSPLNSGLAVEVAYQPGEIMQAEKIYFFRKKLLALVITYLSYSITMPLFFLGLGYVWGMYDYCFNLLMALRPFIFLLLPIFFLHALTGYLFIKKRVKSSEDYTGAFVFQFTEEGCGVRVGERYAVLAWWNFEECWETEEQFLILLGQKGDAMYVIPKRIFPDQAGLRFLKSLLKRKVAKYSDLVE